MEELITTGCLSEEDSYPRIQTLFELAFIFYPVIRSFLNFIIPRLHLEDYSIAIYFIIGLTIVLYAIPDIIPLLRFRDLFIYTSVIIFYELSRLLHPENEYWLNKYQFEFLFCIFPYFFLGMALNNIRLRYERLYSLSRLGIVVQAITLIMHSSKLGELGEQMGKSYTMLPLLMLLTYSLFEYQNKKDIIFVALGCICLLIDATRGPIFLYIIFVGIMAVIYKNTLLLLLLTVGGALFLIDGIRNSILLFVIAIFNKSGFDTRVFDYILANDAANLNYRDVAYYSYVRNMIRENPFGNGIFSDRRAIRYGIGHEATYAHNLILELQCHYGIIMGIVILGLIILLLIKGFIRVDQNKRIMYLILVIIYFGKLFFSSSYLLEKWFFVLIGLSYALSTQYARLIITFGKRQI